VEDGIRYIYETLQSKTDDGYDLITFKKTKEDGTLIEERKYKLSEARYIWRIILRKAKRKLICRKKTK